MSASTPYYLFGAERRALAWHGGPGGIPAPGVRSAEARELSGADLIESGLNPYSIPNPAFNETSLHEVGDWPLVRPSGPEPSLGLLDDLSFNEGKVIKLAIAGGLLYLLLRHGGVLGKGARRR
jgi:hypothetical protein